MSHHNCDQLLKSFVLLISCCLAVTANASNISASPPTVNISTGLIKLGHTDTVLPTVGTVISFLKPTVNWGDGSTNTSAMLDCKEIFVPNPLSTKLIPLPPIPEASCDYWGEHTFSNAKKYTITVTYELTKHFNKSITVYPIGDFVIASIGDSVASGEGNPVVPVSLSTIYAHSAYWDYGGGGCHGSSLAGPGIAANQIRSANSNTKITFIHVACSGAKITDMAGQMNQLTTLLPNGQTIDALLMTVGADSVDGGFSSVVDACVGPYPSKSDPTAVPDPTLDCTISSDANSKNMRDSLATIPNLDYSPIANKISSVPLNIPDSNVYITEYFDPTHDSAGNFPTLAESTLCSADLLLPDELMYLYYNMVIPLNDRIKTVSNQYGWHDVGGIASDFLNHGYCIGSSGTSWVVSLPTSLKNQGNVSGTSHPNSHGQNDYATHLVTAINTWTVPVTNATATSEGGSYTFDTWTHGDVTVTLSATNKLATAGTQDTKYSIDDSTCSDTNTGTCTDYASPISVTDAGVHTLYYLSDNKSGNFEKVKNVQIKIDKPVGNDDSITTTADKAVSDQLQATDPNSSDTLTFGIVDQPTHGTVTLTDVNKGTFTYTPAAGYVGADNFTFMLNNGYVDSNTATESVTVAAAVTSGSQPSGSGSRRASCSWACSRWAWSCCAGT